MYSALHIMQWFSHSLDVFTPKIKRKFFDFYILWIKTNVAYTRLEMIARTKYCTTTTASNWFVTLYYKLLPAVRSPSKHGRWRSSLLLYSISMMQDVPRSLSLGGCSHCDLYTMHDCNLSKSTLNTNFTLMPGKSRELGNFIPWKFGQLEGNFALQNKEIHKKLLEI